MEGDGRRMMVASTFPNTLMLDILPRLPVKSLIRFKCASKSWYKLISHIYFQHLHHSRSQRSLRFFFRIGGFDYNRHENQDRRFAYRFATVESRGIIHGRFVGKVDNPIKLVLPACCGLICFGTERRIYLCNPATYNLLPLPPSPRPAPIAGFGFGYVPSIKAFKVVRFTLAHPQRPFHVSAPINTNIIECSVFTLPLARGDGGVVPRSGPWRVLNQHCPCLVDQFSYPAFANETIYWKINRRHRPLHSSNNTSDENSYNDNVYILAMHIKEEKFGVINHPSDWRENAERSTQVVELNERLFLAETCTCHVLLWMLSDPHKSIWIKQCFVDLRGIDPAILGEIKCFRNGEVLFSSLANIVFFYDVQNKRFRQVQLPFPAFECAAYSESLSFPGT